MGLTTDITEAVEAWVVATLPDLQDSFDHATDEHYGGFPDVAIEIVNATISRQQSTDARLAQLQQVEQFKHFRVYDLEIILVYPPDDAKAAEDWLKNSSDALVIDALQHPDLGGRVSWVNDTPRVGYRPPLVEFDDGSRGRIVTVYMQVGQSMEEA